MVVIVPRSEWNFPGWNGSIPPMISPSDRLYFMGHYEGGNPVGHQRGIEVPQAINRYHQDGRGWAAIGYNFAIDNGGMCFEGRGWDVRGAHSDGYNTSAIGVQIHIGGDEEPSPEAKRAFVELHEMARERFGRRLELKGHRDGNATACPGEPFYAWLKAGIPIDQPPPPPPPPPGVKVKVYLEKLKYGQRDSDSVKALQEALNAHSLPAPGNITLPVTGNYLDMTSTVVVTCQRVHGFGNDPLNSSYVGPRQAAHLFAGRNVEIIGGGTQPPPPPTNINTPFPGAVIGTPFGRPGNWAAGFHTGDDYPCPVGTPLRATWTSRVVGINIWGRDYGNHVVMEHIHGGVTHRIGYCHMDRITVRVGQSLVPGSHVGYSGKTGRSAGPHVHVEDRLSPFGYNSRVVKPVL